MKMSGKIYRPLLCVLLIVMASTPLWAKDKAIVAVLPFSVHSAENIDYVRQGVMDMLTSRISANENITVIGKEKILEMIKTVKSKDLSPAEVSSLGKRLNADYAVWGSITKIGNGVNIYGKLVDIAANNSPVGIFTLSPGMDDVITKIGDFAQRINQFVMGTPPANAAPVSGIAAKAPALSPPTPQAPVTGSRETQIIEGMKSGSKSTLTGSINPDFITGIQPLDKKGFWMSQKYPSESKGVDIGKGRPKNVYDGIVATPEPDVEKRVIQPRAGLPSATRLSLMQTILQRMNSSMMTSGRYVILVPEIGKISVDCEMIPVIEFDDGSVVFIDFKKQMPENIKRIIRKYWTNYTVVTANVQDDILISLAKAINASKAYSMKEQLSPLTFGQKPSFQLPVDWVISGKPSSSKGAYIQALTAIKTEDRRLPKPVTTYLEKNRMIITEMLNETILPPWPDPHGDMNTTSPLPRLNSRSNKDIVLDLLVRLNFQPVVDKDVQLFDTAQDGFNISIKADIEVQNVSRRIIYTSTRLPKQLIDILQGKAMDIIILPEDDVPKATVEKTLSAFAIPYSTAPYMFPVSAMTGVKIFFPTIRFVTSKGAPFYLIDFDLDAALYTLLHDTMGFNIIRY